MSLKYCFKIGRDYGTEEEFSYPVSTFKEAILIENVVCCIANDNILGVNDSIGGLVQTDEFNEYEDYYDNESYEDFNEKVESMTELNNKRPNLTETEKIVKAFILYINNSLNYKFFLTRVLSKLDSK